MTQPYTQQAWPAIRPLLGITLALFFSLAIPIAFAAKPTPGETLQLYLESASDWPDKDLPRETLLAFYQPREFMPLWVNGSGPLPKAELLLRTLNEAHREGLDNAAYNVTRIEQNWLTKNPAALARLELLLSSAVLNYGRDMQVGRSSPNMLNPLWYIPVSEFDGAALLENLARSEDTADVLAALAPPHPDYRRLRSALAYYRQLAHAGGWPTIPDGPSLRLGGSDPRVPLLRRRLFIEGDLVLDVNNEDPTFDEILKLAVERFQVRHGLKIDGVVGPATLAAMNVSIGLRIEQIKLNMERWRWLPRDLGERYILVNTAGFQLSVHEQGKMVRMMEVVAGRDDRPTPIIAGSLHSVVFNPYWGPTPTIIIEDLIPKQLRDPTFMSSHKIRVYRNGKEIDPRKVDWRKVNPDYLPYVLRQDPGPLNPMGRVKFLFSNNFNIYLHDTPQRRLFNRQERAYSSGCIRVSEAEWLAGYVLSGNTNGWDNVAVRRAIASRQPQTVALTTPLPIYLLYFTSWVGSDNRTQFRDDVYQLDSTTQACPEKS